MVGRVVSRRNRRGRRLLSGVSRQRDELTMCTKTRVVRVAGAGAPPLSHPVSPLGLVLMACEPATLSEALAARLGALVETVEA